MITKHECYSNPTFTGSLKALGLECGALGRQYPLTPSNMGLEYLIDDLGRQDTTLQLSGNSIEEVETKANIELQKIHEWFKANKLSVHAGKTKIMQMFPKGSDRPMNLLGGNKTRAMRKQV